MTEKEFKNLLNCYSKNEATEKEAFFIESFLEGFQKSGISEGDIKFDLALKNRIYTTILSKKKKINFFNIKNITAAVVLLFITTSIILNVIKGEPQFIEVTAERGEQSKILLNDSSIVYLNSGSTLRYPKKFGKNLRNVTLEGEAFFKVKSNPKKPFVVNSNAFKTKVLGTEFVVTNYQNAVPSVTVSSGKVQVTSKNNPQKSILLIKNERVKLLKDSKDLIKEYVKAKDFTAWIDGSIVFNKFSLVEVVAVLNQRFDKDIKIVSNNDLECTTVSGIYKNKSLNDILESLHFIYDIEFNYSNNQSIEITVKPCKN